MYLQKNVWQLKCLLLINKLLKIMKLYACVCVCVHTVCCLYYIALNLLHFFSMLTGNLLPIIGCFYESFISNHMSEESPALYICNSTIKTPNVFPANSWSSAIQAHILVVVHGFKLYLNVCVWI